MTKTADPVHAEERVQQRYLERQVRKYKRRAQVAITDDEKKRSDAKAREWSSKLKEFTETKGRKRLRAREQIASAR